MAKNVADELRRDTLLDLSAGVTMTQYMAAQIGGRHTGDACVFDQNVAYCG